MFQEVERELSFASWILQLVAAYCGPIAMLMVVDTWLKAQDTLLEQVLSYVLVGAIAAAMALVVSLLAGDPAKEGRWVWVIPFAFELMAVAWELLFQRTHGELCELFVVRDTGPMAGENGWVMVLLTIPTWSCCCYSLVMWQQLRRRSSERALR